MTAKGDNKTELGLLKARAEFERGEIDKHAYIAKVHPQHRRLFEYPDFLALSDVAELRIRPDGISVVSKETGIELILDPDDEHLTPMTLLNFGRYEMGELSAAERSMPRDGVFLDIGANVGWYSIHIARTCPQARIFAFEPMHKTCLMLQRNLDLNGVADRVEVVNQGVADAPGEQTFHYTEQCSGATSMEHVPHLGEQKKVVCQVTTVDEFVAGRGIAPSLIKCDVEGAEHLVVRGALETLRMHRPALLLELLRKWAAKFGYHPNDVIDQLAELGYACLAVRGDALVPFTHMDEDTVETNFVFLHREQHRDRLEKRQ